MDDEVSQQLEHQKDLERITKSSAVSSAATSRSTMARPSSTSTAPYKMTRRWAG